MKFLIPVFFLPFTVLAQEAAMKAGEFTFDLGKSWDAGKPTSRMVAGVATHKETKAMIKAYYFGQGQGGGIEANIKRWKGQFSKLDSEKLDVKKFGERKAHVLFCTGTYQVGAMFGPKTPTPDYAMLGAILESQDGAVFLKLTAPKKDTEKLRADFDSLLASAYPKP